jgi:hypothetical protein
MLAAAIWLSLSQAWTETTEQENESIAVYPIIMSISVPIICSVFAVWSKFALIKRKISPADFTLGYLLIGKGGFFIASIFYF